MASKKIKVPACRQAGKIKMKNNAFAILCGKFFKTQRRNFNDAY